MESKPITDSEALGQDAAVPPALIAQAEAAIAGNTPLGQRRPSRQLDPNHSQNPNTLRSADDRGLHAPM